MSYHIGFRFGWIRYGKHALGWYDGQIYQRFPHDRRAWQAWKIWFK